MAFSGIATCVTVMCVVGSMGSAVISAGVACSIVPTLVDMPLVATILVVALLVVSV